MIRDFRALAARICWRAAAQLDPSGRGVTFASPGSFYSPLLDLAELEENPVQFHASTEHGWKFVDLRKESQVELLEKMIAVENPITLLPKASGSARYGWKNDFFVFADAWALSRILAVVRPRRVIEVGSGFSSAVMLDVRDWHGLTETEWTFIEPYPDRLKSLLKAEDWPGVTLRAEPVQKVPDEVFRKLQPGDILFIDSSHVGKVGSDLADLLVRVLPQLAPGVWVHFHDVFYPYAYPLSWLEEGRAWNEVIFIQSLLANSREWQVEWFNAFASVALADQMRPIHPSGKNWGGGSLWLRKASLRQLSTL